MRDLLVTLIVIGCLPIALVRPVIGIYLFAWLSYMNPHRLTWGSAYEMPFAAMAAAATILGLAFGYKEVNKLPWSRITIVLVMWIIWMNITTWFALNPDLAQAEWDRTMKIQVMTLVTALLIQSKEKIIGLVWVIALSIGFFGLKGGLFTILTGGNYRVWGPPGSFFEDNNAMALATLMAVPLLFFLYQQATNVWIKSGLLIVMPASVLSILGSYSRGAFLALGASAFYLLMKSNKRILMLPLLAALGISAFAFMPDHYFDRLNTLRNVEEDSSAQGRFNAWWFAYNLAKDRPLVGGGFQTFQDHLFLKYAPEPGDVHDSHSIYFEVLGEHGFVGLVIFLLLGYFTLREGTRIKKMINERQDLLWAHQLTTALQVSTIAYAVGGLFLGLAYFDLYYHVVVLMAITALLVSRNNEVPMPVENSQPAHTVSR